MRANQFLEPHVLAIWFSAVVRAVYTLNPTVYRVRGVEAGREAARGCIASGEAMAG